jgi:hypothetical protein
MAPNPFLAGQMAARGQDIVPQALQRDLMDVMKLRAWMQEQQQAQSDRARQEQERGVMAQARNQAVAGAPEDMRALLSTPQGFNAWVESQFKDKAPAKPDVFGSAQTGYSALMPDGSVRSLMPAAPDNPEAEPLVAVIGPDNKPVLVRRSQAEGLAPAGSRDDRGFDQEDKLRTQFNTLAKPYREVAQGLDKVEASLGLGTGAGDTAAIFAYAKILDPNSVVRESEFAQMQNVGGLVGRLSSLYNQAKDGQVLTPEQRQQIRAGAVAQIQPYRNQYDAMEAQYRTIAGEAGLEADRVINSVIWPEFETAQKPPATTGVPAIDDAALGAVIDGLR